MTTVRAKVGISGWESLLPIERFIPTLEHFSEIFETPLVACVEQEHVQPHEFTEREVFIHFFYRTTTGAGNEETTITSVFGYKSSRPLRCWKPHITHNPQKPLRDLAGTLVAHREKRSIFIDFDFLQNSWNGHEDVLWLILWYLLPYVLPYPSAEYQKTAGLFAKYLRNHIYQREEPKQIAFTQFRTKALEQTATTCDSDIKHTTEKMLETETIYMNTVSETAKVEEFLRWLPNKIPTDEVLGKEFDSLHNLPDVLRVEVLPSEEKTKGTIRLSTQRLFQMIPPPPKKGKRYDIGSFDVYINPFAALNPVTATASAIYIQQRDPGPHKKLYIEETSCLGNKQDTGLNYAAVQLWAEAQIVPLVHLIFTFFKFDTKIPIPNTSFSSQKELSAPLPKTTEEEYQRERERYIEFMKEVLSFRLSQDARKKLEELQKQRADSLQELCNLRVRREELKTFLRFLKEKFNQTREDSPAILQEVLSHPAVIGVEINEGLRVWLYNGQSIPFPRLLWITAGGLIRLISLDDFSGKNTNHGINFDPPEEEVIRKSVATGNYFPAITAIVDFTTRPIYLGDS